MRSRPRAGLLCPGLPNVGDRLTKQTRALRRRVRWGDAPNTGLRGSGKSAVRRARVRTATARTLRRAAVTSCSRARAAQLRRCRRYTYGIQKRLRAR